MGKPLSTPFVITLFIFNLILHFTINVKMIKREFLVIGCFLSIGLGFDLLMNYLSIFKLREDYFLWLPMIWMTFATTVLHSIQKLFLQKNSLLFLLGFLFGPLSYVSAGKFQLLNYTQSWALVSLHCLFWGGLILIFKFVVKKIVILNEGKIDEQS